MSAVPRWCGMGHGGLIIVFCLSAVSISPAASPLPADMNGWALKALEHIYNEQFREAEQEAGRIMRSYPDHPAGYFFQAVVLDARMERHHSDAAENEFYRHCDLAITKGERMLEERPDDLWAKFFMAGANGAKGAYESRFERWITAFRHGWQGVSVFREILDEDPSIRDVCYGIGLYNYWRSAMTKMLWWMPGVEDKRDEAIAMMFDAMRNGQFVRQASAAELLPMLCNEGRYAKALRIADEMIEKYPRYLAFRWGRAEALLGLKRFAQAEQSCTHILSRLGTGPEGRDEFGLMLCNLYLARAYLGLGRPAEALRACKHMSSFTVGDALEKRAEDLLAEGEKIERSAKRALAR